MRHTFSGCFLQKLTVLFYLCHCARKIYIYSNQGRALEGCFKDYSSYNKSDYLSANKRTSNNACVRMEDSTQLLIADVFIAQQLSLGLKPFRVLFAAYCEEGRMLVKCSKELEFMEEIRSKSYETFLFNEGFGEESKWGFT